MGLDESTKKAVKALRSKGYTVQNIADELQIPYISVYYHTRMLERGFPSIPRYKNYLARKHRRKSYSDYVHSRPKNEKLSEAIQTGLKAMNKTYAWLAGEIEVSRESVSKYARGIYTPKKEILAKILKIIPMNHTLEELISQEK